MPEEALAKRYAEALYEVASAEGLEDRIGSELAELERLWRELPELGPFLAHPLIPEEEKERFLDAFHDFLHPYTLNLVRLMVRKRRAALFPVIQRAYLKTAEEQGRLVYVLLRSTRGIPRAELEALKTRLEEALGKKVALTVEEAPELFAGAELVIRGRRLDASLRGRLAKLSAGLRG